MSSPVAQETELPPAVSDDAGENIQESKAQGWALILALGAILPYIALVSYLTPAVNILGKDSDGHSVLSRAIPSLGFFANTVLFFLPALAFAVFTTNANGKTSGQVALGLAILFCLVTIVGIVLSFIPA